MGSPVTRSASQVFVSATGIPLPRWVEAFPKLVSLAAGKLGAAQAGVGQIWLRVDASGTGLEQLTALRAACPAAAVIILADRPDDDEALELFSAGVRGYINAHATAANLKQVAQVVQAGGLWIGPSLMARLVAATNRVLVATPVEPVQAQDALSLLTGREREVAREIAKGASNKEIARRLDISERTVKAHASAVFEKLGARDRLQLALIVNGHGSPPPAPRQAA